MQYSQKRAIGRPAQQSNGDERASAPAEVARGAPLELKITNTYGAL